MNWMEFRQLVDTHFNKDEVRTLCFDLGIDYDSLGGEEKTGKIRELINYMKRLGLLDELLRYLKTERPNVSWPDVFDSKDPKKQVDYNQERFENPVRIAVWNALHRTLWTKRTFLNSHKTKPPLIEKFSAKLWAEYINKPIDSRPKEADLILQEIRKLFFSFEEAKWRDFLEFILNYWNDLKYYKPMPINRAVNIALERIGSNLRYIPEYLHERLFIYGDIVETDLTPTPNSVAEIPEKIRSKIYQEAWGKYSDFSTRKISIKKEIEAWWNQQNQS